MGLRITWALAALILMAVSVQPADGQAFSDQEIAFIRDNPIIRVGGGRSRIPLEYVENGEYRGVVRELLDLIESRTGLQFRVETPPWESILPAVDAAEIDMVPMMYPTRGRAERLWLTNPYMELRRYAFARRDNDRVGSMDEAAGKTFAVTRGFAQSEYLRQDHPQVNVLDVDSLLDAIDAVVTGRADYLIGNLVVVSSMLRRHGIVEVGPEFTLGDSRGEVVMATRRDWPELQSILQKTLDAIGAEAIAGIVEKWSANLDAGSSLIVPDRRLSQAEEGWFGQRRPLVACVRTAAWPIEGMQNSLHQGIAADYATVVAKRVNVQVAPVPNSNWPQIVERLNRGDCDFAPFAVINQLNANQVSFSHPYLSASVAVVTHNDQPFFNSIERLARRPIAIVEGYFDPEHLRQRYPYLDLVIYPSRDQAYAAVVDDDVYGVLDLLLVASHATHQSDRLKISAVLSEYSVSVGMATARDGTTAASALGKILATLEPPHRQDILDSWSALATKEEEGLSRQTYIVAAVCALLVLSLLILLRRVRGGNAALHELNRLLQEQRDSAQFNETHDAVTHLPNRRKMLEDLEALLQGHGADSQPLGMLYIDLEHFKVINDSLGHAFGSRLMKEVALRIRSKLRKDDRLYRMDGDEFAVLLTVMPDADFPEAFARSLIHALTRPFQVLNRSVSVGISVGIALYPTGSSDAESLIAHAEGAMYAAKRDGRNIHRHYHEQQTHALHRRMRIETGLREAVAKKDFALEVQPIVDLRTQSVTKAEALVRWEHPEFGAISPAVFVAIAEESGLDFEIGQWVICETSAWIRRYSLETIGLDTVSINLSSRAFLRGDIPKQLDAAVRDAGIAPRQLEIEISERHMFDAEGEVLAALRRLQRAGHPISVDDFGTGYSSLSYLRGLPLDLVKIDRSFVKDIPTDSRNYEITCAIIELAHRLNLRVIAEGVESEFQYHALVRAGCDFAQGFYFSPAVPPGQFASAAREIESALRAPGISTPGLRERLGLKRQGLAR